MKTPKTPLRITALLTSVLLAIAGTASAQIYAFDSGTNYTSGWNNGNNFGFGFNAWTLANANVGGGFSGFYIGNPITAPTGNSFGMYANSGSSNAAVAFRGFTNSLATNQVFKFIWANHGIGNTSANRGGISLRHGNFTDDFDDGSRFDFYYIGGGQNSFVFEDGSGVTATGITFQQGPLEVEITLETNDTYRLVVKDITGSTILYSIDGQPLDSGLGANPAPGNSTIDSFSCYALNTGGDQNFNDFQLTSTSLIPPTVANVQPADGSIFVDPTQTNVTFEVDSAFSTVSLSGVSLLLNGVAQSGLQANTASPTNQLLVTNTATLLPDVNYNATIIAADANGNRVTNSFTFNTWVTNLFFIEAEDYNYSMGGYIPDPTPNSFGIQSGMPLLGTNGVDYFKPDPAVADAAGATNLYRPGDLVDLDAPPISADVDHDGFAANMYVDYNLSFVQVGEWENYTRKFTNATQYAVYARIANFSGGSATVELDQDAATTATTTNQPRAALGTFVAQQTSGAQSYEFVPLSDFFSSNVLVRFSSTSPTTLRSAALSSSYNLNYLIFVPVTNTATLKPYISSGFPFPSANAGIETTISFVIANRQTAVNPATIKLLLNSNDVTSGITLSNNAAGATVTYIPPSLLTPNSTNTITAIYSDNGGTVATFTNTWQFTTANATVLTLPPADAQPSGSFTIPGFGIHIVKAPDDSPSSDFSNTIASAELQLAGLLTNGLGVPYPNTATNANGSNFYAESNTINYDITGGPTGSFTFPTKSPFPYVPASGTNNWIAMEAEFYAQLGVGQYIIQVRSDDGFRLTCGPTPTDTNFVVGQFDGGRGNGTPTTMYVNVTTAGLYPMRLLYYQGMFGGNVEFYSLNRASGNTPILINDTNSVSSLRAFQAAPAGSPVTILNLAHSGATTTFSFLTQSGHNYVVQYKVNLTDPTWLLLTNVTGNGATANIVDPGAGGTSRFYHVQTQ
jgi:hypothetical protein